MIYLLTVETYSAPCGGSPTNVAFFSSGSSRKDTVLEADPLSVTSIDPPPLVPFETFSCNECDAKFVRKEDLKSHQDLCEKLVPKNVITGLIDFAEPLVLGNTTPG